MHRPHKRARIPDAEWDQRKYQIVDNADRMRASPFVSDVPSAELLPGDAPARNLLVCVNQLRTTGNPRVARSIRSDKQPIYKDLFWNDTWNAPRGVYSCANCGKHATPAQLESWYNPGLSNQDLALAMPLFDSMGQRDRQSRAFAPPLSGPVQPSHTVLERGERRVVIPNLSSGRTYPPTLVCSKPCFDEQIRHNQYRASAYYGLQERVSQVVPATNREIFEPARRHGGRLPRMKPDTFDSAMTFDERE